MVIMLLKEGIIMSSLTHSYPQDKEFYEECKKESFDDDPDDMKKANGKIPFIPISNVPVPMDYPWPGEKVSIKKQ